MSQLYSCMECRLKVHLAIRDDAANLSHATNVPGSKQLLALQHISALCDPSDSDELCIALETHPLGHEDKLCSFQPGLHAAEALRVQIQMNTSIRMKYERSDGICGKEAVCLMSHDSVAQIHG